METTQGKPHDAVFKQFLTHIDTARDFLDIHLPTELRAICDLNTLQLASGSFVEEDLTSQYSDVLYSLKMQDEEGYLHILLEHQSSPDKKMAFRLMRYAIAVMQRHIESGHKQLPLVIPILFYQGKLSPYPYSLCWLDMFPSSAQAKRLYSEPFPLVDITVIPDDEIMQHRRIAILELLQKHIRHRDLMELRERLVTLLQMEYTTESQILTLLHYMLHSGYTEQPKIFYNELASRTPQGEVMMTLGEWFEDQGIQKGIQKGIQEGMQQGKTEASRRVAIRLLGQGMSPEFVAQMTDLTIDDINKLAR